MNWFQALLPREQKFFDLFEAHAATLRAGATSLRHLLNGGEAVPLYCAEVARHENDADEIAREVLRPAPAEQLSNPRSASAKLRWAKRSSG